MDGSVRDLSRYRLERAFHSLRAITALDGFDSGKHSGIIAFVNQNYVKTGIFDKSFSKLVDSAFRLREKADYEDFYIVAIEDAAKQIKSAETVIAIVEEYVKSRWKNADA